MRIEVTFPRDRWPAVTDVGVTVWDTSGYFVSEGPLNYAFGRQVVALDSTTPRVLDLEILPGFARPDEPSGWEADVMVVYLPAQPHTPPVTRSVTLLPGEPQEVPWPPDSLPWVPAGHVAFREISILTPGGGSTVLQALDRQPTGSR
jgi:hypothetical protein